ncbi:MAG: MobC family plasmid mobilization relaxosome protein [Saccharofermentans sp.]|nr:MobC family plasmid mobilization relaxosome protein [Saccharofermentans sp.]
MKDKNLHIRISDVDYEIIRSKASLARTTISQYVLKCCLEKQIFVIDGLDEVLRQQKFIGNNLNQLARLANSGAISVVGLTEMVDLYSQVSHKLNELLERRRWR